MKNKTDALIQKYLRGQATQEERDILLAQTLKDMNNIMFEIRNLRGEQQWIL